MSPQRSVRERAVKRKPRRARANGPQTKGMCLEDRPILKQNAAGKDIGEGNPSGPGWESGAGVLDLH